MARSTEQVFQDHMGALANRRLPGADGGLRRRRRPDDDGWRQRRQGGDRCVLHQRDAASAQLQAVTRGNKGAGRHRADDLDRRLRRRDDSPGGGHLRHPRWQDRGADGLDDDRAQVGAPELGHQ